MYSCHLLAVQKTRISHPYFDRGSVYGTVSCCQQCIWLQFRLDGLKIEANTILHTDNNSANELARNAWKIDHFKDIDEQYQYVRENHNAIEFELIYIKSEDNLADIFTKSLPKLANHKLAINIRHTQQEEVLKIKD